MIDICGGYSNYYKNKVIISIIIIAVLIFSFLVLSGVIKFSKFQNMTIKDMNQQNQKIIDNELSQK
jgi:hypothetical protein